MPLFDITNKIMKVKPEDAESYEALVKLRNNLSPRTFDRMVLTVDAAIESCQPSERSRLVWTRSSQLFGHGSAQPHKHVEHMWRNIESVVGPDKMALKAVGGMLRWRISLRAETWLVYRRDSDRVDDFTGKLITISEYWINEDFKEEKKSKSTKASAEDLTFGMGPKFI